jgi:hypothetical protein
LVTQAVQTVVTEFPLWLPHRDVLVNVLIEALETKASWVDLYGVTGELDVPGKGTQGELLEPLQRVKEVCGSHYCQCRLAFMSWNQVLRAHRHSYPPQGIWREIKIPVDVPRMSVSISIVLCMGGAYSPLPKDRCSGSYPHLVHPIFDRGFNRPFTAIICRPAYFCHAYNHNVVPLGGQQKSSGLSVYVAL